MFIKYLQKNTLKKKLIVLLKFTKKLNFLAILEIYLQLSTKVFYKNSINNNNKNITKILNKKILNSFTKISTFLKILDVRFLLTKKLISKSSIITRL